MIEIIVTLAVGVFLACLAALPILMFMYRDVLNDDDE